MAVGRGVFLGRPFKQVVDLLVGRLREIAIPEADGVERLGCPGTDGLVGFILELRAGFRGADGSSAPTASITSSEMRSMRTTSSLSTRTPPLAIAPIANSS